jgi:hypothetical protein
VNSSHEHITHVGNPSVPWKLTVEQVIQNIDGKVDTFYVVLDREPILPNGGKAVYSNEDSQPVAFWAKFLPITAL